MSLSDERNWDDYFYGFCESFKYIEEDLTDPDRFPKGMSQDGASGYACIILHWRVGAAPADRHLAVPALSSYIQ